MSNYYISNCCKVPANIVAMLGKTGAFQCTKCFKECQVTAVSDTPGGVPKEEKSINFMQIGDTVECGNCHPEKFEDCKNLEKMYDRFKCNCKCHDMPPTIAQLKDEAEQLLEGYFDSIDWEGVNTVEFADKVKATFSSHLQKTYEVAEKAGYERAKRELNEERSDRDE